MPSGSSIVFIGPAATGKSTIGGLLASALGRTLVDADEVGDRYYAEVGWSIDRLVERIADVGRVAAEREWEAARAHAVARIIEDYPGAVIALGAGHASYTDAECHSAVRDALSVVPHVILLLPSLNRAEALHELRTRSRESKGTDWVRDGHDFLAEWFDDPGTRALATMTVVTGHESPAHTVSRLRTLLV
ncbi:shikimate kinase [Sanguibacter sp. A247]|uniref:shikimate kinase n=1 Tax=unclassified Sanguibacter TaxID=2645534 RepID=UPI003FD852F3